jgi:hypothetical protein
LLIFCLLLFSYFLQDQMTVEQVMDLIV